MLEEFLVANRADIIARAAARVVARRSPEATDIELERGIPLFLTQLCEALRNAKEGRESNHDALTKSAGQHGSDLLRIGLTVAQVVRDYGDLCQSITELAVEKDAQISAEDFQVLNLCLDDAIAEAVTEYSRLRDFTAKAEGAERLGMLAHELRNQLNTAVLSFDIIKRGQVGAGGSTGAVHNRSLMRLRDLIDRSLADVRLDSGLNALAPIGVSGFLEEIEITASVHAQSRGVLLSIPSVDRSIVIDGDRQILAAALSNLLQNAFKFTPRGGTVCLHTQATADRVIFDVEDECGGLPPGRPEELFEPYVQRGADKSGMGLGLTICLKAALAHGGALRVRDVPEHGCVFTLDLPRLPPQPLTLVGGGGGKDTANKPRAAAGSSISRAQPG